MERCGAFVRVENVPAHETGKTLAYLLTTFRELSKQFGELIPGPDVIPGGDGVEVVQDWWEGDQRTRRVGFR